MSNFLPVLCAAWSYLGCFILFFCAMAHSHTVSPAAEVSSTLLFQGHAIGRLLTKHPHPLPEVSQLHGTFHLSVKSVKSPPLPRPNPHESSLTEGQLGGWDHTRGEGAQEVKQGFRSINPRPTVVTHSLTQNGHGPRQSLTHTATSQMVVKKKKKRICCKEGSTFPTNGKAFQDSAVSVPALKSTGN